MTNDVMGPRPAIAGCLCRICMPQLEDPHERPADAEDDACLRTVLRVGWQVILVGPGSCSCCGDDCDDDDDSPAFAYTIGLTHRTGHPELAISGLSVRLMHSVLNYVAAQVVAGHRVRPGDVIEGALGNVPVTVDAVSGTGLGELGGWSSWFHRRPVEVLQLVWPTTGGIFAWQPGAPPELDQLQPPDWRDQTERVGALAADPPWPLPVPPDTGAITCVHVRDGGQPIRFVSRLPAFDGCPEQWQFDCGRDHGPGVDELRSEHVAHAVRSWPSVRQLADLRVGEWAERADAFSPWTRTSR